MKKGVKITVGVLGIGLAFGLGIGGGYYLSSKNNQPSNNNNSQIKEPQQDNEEQAPKIENLNINDSLVKDLYSRRTNYHVATKVTYENLNENKKMYADLTDVNDHEYSSYSKKMCEKLLNSGNNYMKDDYDGCISSGGYNAADKPLIKYILTSDIKNNNLKYFGTVENLPQSYYLERDGRKLSECYLAQYNSIEDNYLVYNGGCMFMDFQSVGVNELIKAEKIDDTIILYDNYLLGVWDNNGNYDFYRDEDKINEIGQYEVYIDDYGNVDIEQKALAKVRKYKHTYKLDKTTNNYYWVSSEPIEYNE